MELDRIGVKFFASHPSSVHLESLIPIFHGWIQKQSVAGHLLIDVHDYSHMHQGPGILLVAHEGNFRHDTSEGRLGLVYYRKIPTSLSPVEHLVAILRIGLQGCKLLEKDAGIRFGTDEFVIIANDRLNAPNTEDTFRELQSAVSAAVKQTFEGAAFKVARTNIDPKERLTVTCSRSS
jgi:hypothetical protein